MRSKGYQVNKKQVQRIRREMKASKSRRRGRVSSSQGLSTGLPQQATRLSTTFGAGTS